MYFNISTPLKYAFIVVFYSFLFTTTTRIEFYTSYVVTIVSTAISLVSNELSAIITACFIKLTNIPHEHIMVFILYSILQFIFVFLFFRIKRFKNGYPFLMSHSRNIYICNFILLITVILIFTHFFIAGLTNIPVSTLIFCFVLFSIIFIITIQQNFILYQKQKLQTQALKDYEQELAETKQKLKTAIQEKEKIVKSNHEFYHRQEALKQKLDTLIQQKARLSMNTEFSEDCSNILDRLNTLSNEYNSKTATLPIIVKSNIPEIDDMLTYMQSECAKNNIEFILKIDCDINYIIQNFITKSQLETLLGDLIKNSIIAINHSSNTYRSIMVVFGIKDDAYELCILDSGIPFEAETLINLGINKASTHLDEGGSGIGFITTFETINSCNASFIINENTNSNYSKSMEIKFDNKHEYIIISDRKEKITELNQSNRKIILK